MKRGNGEGSIYKDGSRGRWVAQVTAGYDEKGRAQLRRRYCKTRAAASAALADLQRRYGCGISQGDNAEMTLGAWVALCVDGRAAHIRPKTLYGYKHTVSQIQKMQVGKIRLRNITGPAIAAAVAEVAATYPRSALSIFKQLKTALRAAFAQGILPRDVMHGLKPPRQRPRTVPVVSEADLQKLLAAAEPKIKALLLLGWSTGLRPEEMLALKWPDIDFSAQKLTVSRAAVAVHQRRTAKKESIIKAINPRLKAAIEKALGTTAQNQRAKIYLEETKTKESARTIELPAALIATLKKWQKQQKAEIMADRKKYQDEDFIFPRAHGQLAAPEHFYKPIKRLAEKAGVPTFTLKQLRHTHATLLFAAGWQAKDVQLRLGHSSITTTMNIYTKAVPRRGEQIAAYLDTVYPDTEKP